MPELTHDEMMERLKRLDEEADLTFEGNNRYHIIIAGGSALVLQRYRDTATHDIDAIYSSHELFPLLEKYDINTRVSTF